MTAGTAGSAAEAAVTGHRLPPGLVEHLKLWAGAWPAARPVRVAANPRRALPAWDGALAPVTGVVTETGAAVLGLSPDDAVRVEADLRTRPGRDLGEWLPAQDPRVPAWLRPFGGEVLVVLERDRYVAGVGLKKHDAHGREIAVGTEEAARGRGLARRLVAQAARRVLDEGAVPTYLHAPENLPSARVAQAAGFPDRGWHVLGFFPRPARGERADPDGG